MKIILSDVTRPSFNLAAEEYALKMTDDEYFMIWQNEPSVIVGRNQNTLAEINFDYIKQHGIHVIRRLTGGGAVFHDLGNVNYTFIKRNAKENFNNYAYFSKPIIDFLNDIGAAAELSGRNDILIDGKKVSGNAQCAFKDGVMHHGTLLFSADMSVLSNALNVNPLKINSKGIKSVRSRVMNICDCLPSPMPVDEFKRLLVQKAKDFFKGADTSGFSQNDIAEISRLETEKYSTWDWNFGFSKPFTFSKQALFPFGIVEVRMNIENSKISSCAFLGDFFGTAETEELESFLEGVQYNPSAVRDALKKADVGRYIAGAEAADIEKLMF